jgi:outer membrane protein OmpA-like peptidoglycan-associated protein
MDRTILINALLTIILFSTIGCSHASLEPSTCKSNIDTGYDPNCTGSVDSFETCTDKGGTWIWNKTVDWHCGNLPSEKTSILASSTAQKPSMSGTSVGTSHYSSDKPVTMILLDASGSMLDLDDKGIVKIESARKVIAEKINQLDKKKTNLGLVAFNNGCGSTQLIVNPDNNDFKKVINKLNTIHPNGTTPLAQAISQTSNILKDINQTVNLVIISDGMETCGGDPVVEATRLMAINNINSTIHVIGYNVDDITRQQLLNIATVGKGTYHDVHSSAAFDKALTTISSKTNIRDKKFSYDGTVYTFNINFASDSDTIDSASISDVEALADYIKTSGYITRIEGYTDALSSPAYNQKLSERRAKSVVKKLIELGVESKNLTAVGYGQERPVASNSSEEGRYLNRRVEAHFIK